MTGLMLFPAPLPDMFLMAEGRMLADEEEVQGSTTEASVTEQIWAWAFLIILLVMLLCIVCVCCGIFARLCGLGGQIFACLGRSFESCLNTVCGGCCGGKTKTTTTRIAPKVVTPKPLPPPKLLVPSQPAPLAPAPRTTTADERSDMCASFACCGLGGFCGTIGGLGAWCGFGQTRSSGSGGRSRRRQRESRGRNNMTCAESVLTCNQCCGLLPWCFPASGAARHSLVYQDALQPLPRNVAQPVVVQAETTPPPAKVVAPVVAVPAPAAKPKEPPPLSGGPGDWRGVNIESDEDGSDSYIGPTMPLLAF